MSYIEKKRYIGNINQLCSATEYRLCGGRADGVHTAKVCNGLGLELSVLPDRGMDISQLSFKGVNFSYIAPCGVVAPQYFDGHGIEFLRGFTAGMLTTCGLTSVGSPCVDEGEELGLHGRISNTPAENFLCKTEISDDQPVIKLNGTLKQTRLFGENLTLKREIICRSDKNSVEIKDIIENSGYREIPFMIIYHFNIGYPLLDENTQLVLPTAKVTPRNDHAATELNSWMNMHPPMDGFEEMCYYHDLNGDKDGNTLAAVWNQTLKLGLVMRFNKNILNHYVEWKMLAPGEYVLGMEPSNCYADGRDAERAAGRLQFLKPDEKKEINITLEVIDGEDEFALIRNETESLNGGLL